MDRPVFVNLETVDGENVSFTIDKKDMGFPEFGFMYTIRRATNPSLEERNIIIPWPQIKKIIIDETLEEEKEDGSE